MCRAEIATSIYVHARASLSSASRILNSLRAVHGACSLIRGHAHQLD